MNLVSILVISTMISQLTLEVNAQSSNNLTTWGATYRIKSSLNDDFATIMHCLKSGNKIYYLLTPENGERIITVIKIFDLEGLTLEFLSYNMLEGRCRTLIKKKLHTEADSAHVIEYFGDENQLNYPDSVIVSFPERTAVKHHLYFDRELPNIHTSAYLYPEINFLPFKTKSASNECILVDIIEKPEVVRSMIAFLEDGSTIFEPIDTTDYMPVVPGIWTKDDVIQMLRERALKGF